jgi:hypothetical protein
MRIPEGSAIWHAPGESPVTVDGQSFADPLVPSFFNHHFAILGSIEILPLL